MAKYTDMPVELLLLVASFLRPPPSAYARHFTTAVVCGNGEEAVEAALQSERVDVVNLSSVDRASRAILFDEAFRCVSITHGDATRKMMALLCLMAANPGVCRAVKHLYINMGKDCILLTHRNLQLSHINPWSEEDQNVLVQAAERCSISLGAMVMDGTSLKQHLFRSFDIREAYAEDACIAFPAAVIILQLQNLEQLGFVAPSQAIQFVQYILDKRCFLQAQESQPDGIGMEPSIDATFPQTNHTALKSVLLQATSGIFGVTHPLPTRGLEQSLGLGMQSEVFLHKSVVTSLPDLSNVTSLVLVKTHVHPAVFKEAFSACTHLTRFIYLDPPSDNAHASLERIGIMELLTKSASNLKVLCIGNGIFDMIWTLEEFTVLEHVWLDVETFKYALELTPGLGGDDAQDEEDSSEEDGNSSEEDEDSDSDISSEKSDDGINTLLARLPNSVVRFHIKGDIDYIEIDLIRLAGECYEWGQRCLEEVAFNTRRGDV